MDKRFLDPKDRNDKVKLGLIHQHAAAQAREAARAKDNLLRLMVQPFVERGYRLEELELIEQQDPFDHKLIGKLSVRVSEAGKLILPATLWIRRAWRHVRPYAYAIKADREHSQVTAGLV
jgi:hypothetical protein